MGKWARDPLREAWAILGIWWLIVPGGGVAAIAAIEIIQNAHNKTFWFWAALAMTALWIATCVRLGRVVRERNGLRVALADEGTREAVANRLDRFALELETLRAELPADREEPGPLYTDEQREWFSSAAHFTERVLGDLRQNAPGFVAYWRTDLNPSPPSNPPSRVNMDAEVSFALTQLRHISQRLRDGHDLP
jgi:hypothetical protein